MQDTGMMLTLGSETGTHTTIYFTQQIALFEVEDLSQIRESQEDPIFLS